MGDAKPGSGRAPGLMASVLTITGRDVGSMYRTPTGWVITALYVALTAMVFTLSTLAPGEPATLRYFFSPAAWLLLAICPAISMRFFSEEIRSGTLEAMAVSPVSDLAIVLGKYLGGVAFLMLVLAPTLAFAACLWALGEPRPDIGAIAAGYLGLALAGAAYLAIGSVVSALTDSQTLSFLATLIVLLGAMLMTGLVVAQVSTELGQKLASLSMAARVNTFARGVIDTGHIVYFLAIVAIGLAASVAVIQARRWA
ncbi:MAG: hypothetical protein CMJ31_10635 [Phycisphaerae bacterium]|nr:hypothetical protein [Phycisphaerae bacterium]